MLKRVFLAALIVSTQTASLIAGPVRGRSFDVTTQIVQISDGSDVTSGTVTVKVSKDGGAQATSTNSASHLGGGQWKVTLTPAEMDAVSVGVQITESGSYTTNQNIITEQPLPFSRWVARYDGSLTGNLLTAFTRNAATVDGVGNTVAANVPRFLQSNRSIASLLNYQATPIALVNTSQLVSGGYDLDGDSIIVALDTAGTIVKFIEIKPDGAPSIVSTTAATALPGAGGGIVYTLRGARVIYGTTIVHAQRTNGAVIEGLTLFVTQDSGATWSRVENSAVDGGGYNVPKPSVYGANADSIPRGREWSTSIFPEGGIDAAGNFNPNDIWFTWTDYLSAGGPTPKGWQCGIVRLTRASTSDAFTIGRSRVLDERWESGATNNFHGHTVGLTGNGLFVFGNGDVEGQHALHTFLVDHDTYESASIIKTNDWFGEANAGAANGRGCPQISMMAPGRNGVIVGSNDTWQSPILQINNAATSATACSISSPITIQADSSAGAWYRGWGNIWLQWNPGLNGYGSEYALGGFNAIPDVMRHYSKDGVNWAALNNSDTFENQHVICGDYFAIIRASDEVLMLSPKPRIQTVNPLMLAPGADNLLTSAAPDAGAGTSGGNTRSLVSYTNGEYRFTSGGALVPNAPKTPAPFPNPIYVYLGCESVTSNAHGSIYAQASGQTINTGTNYLAGTFAIAPLGAKAIGRFTLRVGTAGATNDSTAELGSLIDRSNGYWSPFSLCDNPINNPAAARGTVSFYAGPSASLANDECPMLVAIGGVYLAQLVMPWPCARLSTSNPNEYAEVQLPQTYSNTWTTSGLVIRSEEGATVTGTPPSGPIATIWKDASNYVAVYFDGPNYEVEVTATVAGVPGSTQTIAIEDWPRDFGLAFCAADNGSDILFSVMTPRNGVQTATCSGGSLKGPPTKVRWSDAAQTSVYNYYVAGCEFQDRALTLSQQFWALNSLDFLSTDDQLAARTASEAVAETLATSFAATPNNVWLPTLEDKTIDLVNTNGINANSIQSAAIGNDEIADSAIAASEIADNAFDANTFQANSIGASQIASDAIVEIQSGLALENSVDNIPTVAELNARTLAAASYATAGQINDIETELLNVPTNAEFAAGLDALPTAAENADAVFDEAMAGHTSIGTFGATASNTLSAANAAQSASEQAVDDISALPSAADNVTALFNATLSDTGANKAGRALYYIVQSFEAPGVFTEAALAGSAFPLSGIGLSNFNTFFNNGNAASTKTINNVTAPKNVTINVPQ